MDLTQWLLILLLVVLIAVFAFVFLRRPSAGEQDGAPPLTAEQQRATSTHDHETPRDDPSAPVHDEPVHDEPVYDEPARREEQMHEPAHHDGPSSDATYVDTASGTQVPVDDVSPPTEHHHRTDDRDGSPMPSAAATPETWEEHDDVPGDASTAGFADPGVQDTPTSGSTAYRAEPAGQDTPAPTDEQAVQDHPASPGRPAVQDTPAPTDEQAVQDHPASPGRPAVQDTPASTGPVVSEEPPAVEAPYGPGSASADAEGNGPQGWPVKGNAGSMLFHTPESPSYSTSRAEVWFVDEQTARAAGFAHWDRKQR